jgi:hypothetical protein
MSTIQTGNYYDHESTLTKFYSHDAARGYFYTLDLECIVVYTSLQ